VRAPDATLVALLRQAPNSSIVLGNIFAGSENAPGPLARFLQERRGRALDLYLLLRALAVQADQPVALPATVWARALGLADLVAPETLISRNWSWLESERLVGSVRVGRLRGIVPLAEDASGRSFESAARNHGEQFRLPYGYFLGNFHNRINLAGKTVLLASLSHGGRFAFVSGPPPTWHGLSSDTVKRGLRVLLTLGLLLGESIRVPDPLTSAGYRVERRYVLADPFAQTLRPDRHS
jgi:hypothetical protein